MIAILPIEAKSLQLGLWIQGSRLSARAGNDD
jgi:hypothetical protein